MKRKIIHIISDLGRGGAETLLVNVVNELQEYENIIITLFPRNDFKKEITNAKVHCLGIKLYELAMFPLVALKLKKLISMYQPDLVHSHLYWPNVLARFAVSKNIPLLTTIHVFVSQSADYNRRILKWLEKFSYRFRPAVIIAVAKGALEEYYSFLKLKPADKSFVLYTFADTRKYKPGHNNFQRGHEFKIVTVGALRLQKNQMFLVDAMSGLIELPVSLDIYGEGPLRDELEPAILKSGAKVRLKGQVSNIQDKLPAYDLFVMSSFYEGFSVAVLEAMAMKIPLLLSEIPSFREQAGNAAFYFKMNSTEEFQAKIKQLISSPDELQIMAVKAETRVNDLFSPDHHFHQLRKIYLETIGINSPEPRSQVMTDKNRNK